ncbi:unnamed protein product [Bathycoccus prasinos]
MLRYLAKRTLQSRGALASFSHRGAASSSGRGGGNARVALSYSTDAVVTDFEHSTGLYRAELEGLASGKDIFDHYDFTRAPKGTKESPCVVTSEMEYRVVGVTDPDDDSIVIWGRLEEGKGPMLIGDEWFVHKRVGGGGAH